MNLLPKSHEEFSQQDYWNSFFKKRGNKAFEWYGEYAELSQHLHKYVKTKDEILMVGCGNSTLSNDLYDVGYRNITNIDISQVVIKQMMNSNLKERCSMKFVQMDALNMSFDSDSFTVVLDKGTLDALMPDETLETISRINKYFAEIRRVLKPGGRYLCISLLQEHILKKLLSYFPESNWMFRVVRCHDAENAAAKAGENAMPVFLVICTKFQSLPFQVLEINLGTEDKMQRLQTSAEIAEIVSSVQRAAFVCSGLKRSSIAEENEVMLDLYESGKKAPRFTLYVVDATVKSKQLPYASFIVPQGRESEWLFSTREGRKNLLKMTNFMRLAIVVLHREQTYGSLDDVQKELYETVKNLAPKNATEKIPFLSLGSDVGKREIVHEGTSDCSGKYVIEDVEVSGDTFRRLYFLSSQFVIQSEAKLKNAKSKRGKQKVVVNHSFLTCKHHVYMSIAAFAASTLNKNSMNVAVVGLGGGGLCMFLRKFLQKLYITGIDIDKDMLGVAKEWFHLQEDDQFKVVIKDGLEFIKTGDDGTYGAILFDVDNKDSSVGMSCPPKEFLESDILTKVNGLLTDNGLFILNVVIRDTSLRKSIMETLSRHFASGHVYKLEKDLNEIVVCRKKPGGVLEELSAGCDELNSFFKRNNTKEQLVDKDCFLRCLTAL